MIAIGMSVSASRMKEGFFDRRRVIDSLSRVDLRAKSQLGARVRADAQRSIKTRKGPSSPGKPPHGHTTGIKVRRSKSKGRLVYQRVSPLRERIWFAYDSGTKSVVIGPVGLYRRKSDVPHVLEYGGQSVVHRGTRKGGRMLGARARIALRPYMRPALARQLERLPELYRDKMR